MTDINSTFSKLLNRQATQAEIERLHHVKNALGLHDNDALWMILMALESYDVLYKRYPIQISESVEQIIDKCKKEISYIAETEAKKNLGQLSNAVVETSTVIAKQTAAANLAISLGIMFLFSVAFGAICFLAGVVLGSGKVPYWLKPSPGNFFIEIISTIAIAPLGWLVVVTVTFIASFSLWMIRHDLKNKQNIWIAVITFFLIILSGAYLLPLVL